MVSPPCLDCGKALTRAPMSDAYPKDAMWSSCYLCPFCRTNRYRNEAQALARCVAGLARLRGARMEKKTAARQRSLP